MYKFYWSNLQKSQSTTGAQQGINSHQHQQQQQHHHQSFENCPQSRHEPSPVWTRQNPSDHSSNEMWFGGNPEPLPARSGRPTTVRVTSPSGEREPCVSHRPVPKCENNKTAQHHTPTGSHRVLLKLRRMSAGAHQPRPKSVHGAEQVMVSDNNDRYFNLPPDDTPSILETLANLRTGDLPAKSTKRSAMPNSKSMHHFYSRTWTEKTLQRYQHNYENVYSEQNDNNNDNPVYENVYFRNGHVDNNAGIVIGQMAQSPRSAARMRHVMHQNSECDRKFEPPPEPCRVAPPVPPERKGRSNPKTSSSLGQPKPLYRSKSCERPKMKDAVKDTFRINSDKFQMNFSRISSNLSDKLSTNVMHRFSGGGSVSSSSRMSTGSTDASSNTSHVDSPNSLLQTVALKAIPCVDIQSHGSLSGGSEDGAHTIDHDNQAEDEYYRRANGSNSRPSQSLASRMRDIKQDVQKRFSRLRSRSAERLSQRNVASDRQYTDQSHSESTTCEDTYDGESTPTAARSNWTPSYQCKMPRSYSGIPTQTTSAELYAGPFVARARALVDCTPSPYDREALRFKRGDLIDVISMNPSGLWRGRCESRVGHFKFITVELLPDRPSRERRKEIRQKKFSESRANEEEQSLDEILAVKGKPETVEDLLKQIGLEDHISVFVLNGYEELESFLDLDESELDYLGIHDQRKRSRILAAVECLQDQASVSASPPADVSDKQSPAVVDDYKVNTFHRLSFPRDSGCYASNENLHRSSPAASDRSFHSGSQTESGIHLTNEDEVDDECEDDVEPQKRPIEQVLKTKALRDRHTLTARDLVPMVGDGKTINDKNMVDKNFAALVEKYSANEKVTLEGKFLNARSVFEPANPNSPSKNGPSRP